MPCPHMKAHLAANKFFLFWLGQTNLISGSTGFFQNLKGRLVGKKRKIKKILHFLHWLWLSIITLFKTNPAYMIYMYSDFSKFAFKKCVSMLKLT